MTASPLYIRVPFAIYALRQFLLLVPPPPNLCPPCAREGGALKRNNREGMFYNHFEASANRQVYLNNPSPALRELPLHKGAFCVGGTISHPLCRMPHGSWNASCTREGFKVKPPCVKNAARRSNLITKASLVQREVARRSRDGGIVYIDFRFTNYSKWSHIQSPTRSAGCPRDSKTNPCTRGPFKIGALRELPLGRTFHLGSSLPCVKGGGTP